jgi:hypothetical protein
LRSAEAALRLKVTARHAGGSPRNIGPDAAFAFDRYAAEQAADVLPFF